MTAIMARLRRIWVDVGKIGVLTYADAQGRVGAWVRKLREMEAVGELDGMYPVDVRHRKGCGHFEPGRLCDCNAEIVLARK